ncbi:hypothetical protein Pan241w_41700 [Gimesia alba]|uniref:Uncharacterized protein n=1 Tax=Gimesia alba TaxID=2527973 RepID=A0A517RJK6_9PLAN|nr:hypothetical protein Pan241w_41700 [Gimesia alba]
MLRCADFFMRLPQAFANHKSTKNKPIQKNFVSFVLFVVEIKKQATLYGRC